MVVVVGFVCVSRNGCCCCDCVVVVTPLRFVLAPIKSFKPHGGCLDMFAIPEIDGERKESNYTMVQHVKGWCTNT